MQAEPTMVIRRPGITFPERVDPAFLEDQPELAYTLVAMSLALPYLEPYLIRTMGKAKRLVTDPALREAITLFTGQEAQHYRLHMRFNAAVGADSPRIAALERAIAEDYEQFQAARGLPWNLAYAEGFEAFTTALSHVVLEEQILQGACPAVRDLFEWHIAEEMEHRCVAFDVYEHLCGSYPYRVAVGFFAQRHLTRFILRVTAALLEEDRERGRDHGGQARSRSRVRALLVLAARRLLPRLLETYSPRYTPRRITVPPRAAQVLQRITAWG